VQGRHRFFAVKTLLRRRSIEAIVITDTDRSEVERGGVARDFRSCSMTKTRDLKSIKRWWEHVVAKNLAGPAIGVAGSRSATDMVPGRRVEDPRMMDFASELAATTGQSLSWARRTAEFARTFSEDQLDTLDTMNVSRFAMTTIARNRDSAGRDEVIGLVANGMQPEVTIEQVRGGEVPPSDPFRERMKLNAEVIALAKANLIEEWRYETYFQLMCLMFSKYGRLAAGWKGGDWMTSYTNAMFGGFLNRDRNSDETRSQFNKMMGTVLERPKLFQTDALRFRAVTEGRHVFSNDRQAKSGDTEMDCVSRAFRKFFCHHFGISVSRQPLGIRECNCTKSSAKSGLCYECYGCGYRISDQSQID
jgi:hypothetical protein